MIVDSWLSTIYCRTLIWKSPSQQINKCQGNEIVVSRSFKQTYFYAHQLVHLVHYFHQRGQENVFKFYVMSLQRISSPSRVFFHALETFSSNFFSSQIKFRLDVSATFDVEIGERGQTCLEQHERIPRRKHCQHRHRRGRVKSHRPGLTFGKFI